MRRPKHFTLRKRVYAIWVSASGAQMMPSTKKNSME